LSATGDVTNIEVGILSLLFDVFPERLAADELIRRTMEFDPLGSVEDYKQALRNLRRAQLVRETNGCIIPTKAALHFDRLPF
jgi:hypothetical protein